MGKANQNYEYPIISGREMLNEINLYLRLEEIMLFNLNENP
jgi:hypothetical protein